MCRDSRKVRKNGRINEMLILLNFWLFDESGNSDNKQSGRKVDKFMVPSFQSTINGYILLFICVTK